MHKLIDFIASLLHQIARVFQGSDHWFLVLDDSFVTEKTFYHSDKQSQKNRVQLQRANDFCRRYEMHRRTSAQYLCFDEIWKSINPLSMLQFLRYSLRDVV